MAMGSSLAPAMADIFMNWLVETASTKSNHQFTVHRYVDDLFLTFDDPIHIDHVLRLFLLHFNHWWQFDEGVGPIAPPDYAYGKSGMTGQRLSMRT